MMWENGDDMRDTDLAQICSKSISGLYIGQLYSHYAKIHYCSVLIIFYYVFEMRLLCSSKLHLFNQKYSNV